VGTRELGLAAAASHSVGARPLGAPSRRLGVVRRPLAVNPPSTADRKRESRHDVTGCETSRSQPCSIKKSARVIVIRPPALLCAFMKKGYRAPGDSPDYLIATQATNGRIHWRNARPALPSENVVPVDF